MADKDAGGDSQSPKVVKEVSPSKDVSSSAEKESMEIAQKEYAAFFEKENHERDAKKSAHRRSESLKKMLHRLALAGILIVVILVFIGIIIWSWHLLTHTDRHWLSGGQIMEIRNIASGALFATLISEYSRRYLQ